MDPRDNGYGQDPAACGLGTLDVGLLAVLTGIKNPIMSKALTYSSNSLGFTKPFMI